MAGPLQPRLPRGADEATATARSSDLKRAIELDPQAKEYAAKDEDFDWLRDDPEFPA